MSVKLSDLSATLQNQIKEKYGVKAEAKYRNAKTTVDGICFDSIKEANRYQELKILERKGLISALDRQVKFELVPSHGKEKAVAYIADFTNYDQKHNAIVEDVKSRATRTPAYVIKRKLMLEKYGIEIKEI
jgi:hypothetical protein